MYYILPSHNIPITLVSDIIVLLAVDPKASIDDICSFTGFSQSYVKSGINIAKMLNLIDPDIVDRYQVNIEAVNLLGKTPNEETKISVIRKYIQRYEPFITFIQFCLNDDSIVDSARKVYTLYKFQGKDFNFLKDLFVTWGTMTNIFNEKSGKLILAEEINSTYRRYITEDLLLNDDMAIRIHIADRLGDEVFTFMLPAEIEDIVNAFKSYKNDQRNALDSGGRAFEDFLRRISDKIGINVTSKSGIVEVINALYNNKDATGKLDNKVHYKQNAIGGAIGNIRNMSGHGLDPKTLERWDLTSQSALAYLEILLSTIRSIYMFVEKGVYTF
ncbi:MAG TPA: hypothetical protein GXX35_01950 [Thermoanaerobacterales bacterium]|nr:hypothetical protein [Thermoanaerobacterales bacterium]